MKKITALKSMAALCCIVFLGFFHVNAQQNLNLINTHLAGEREKNGWLPGDISDWIISDQYTDETTGLTHTYIQQRHHRIVVFNAISVFAIKEGKVLYFKPGLIDHLENKVNADQPTVRADAAVAFALKYLGKTELAPVKPVSNDTATSRFVFESPAVANSPIKVQLVYRATEHGVLLAWDVSIEMKGEPHWWNVRVDALTGAFIDKNDFTVECNFGGKGTTSSLPVMKGDESLNGSPPFAMPVTVPDYRVFPFPIEAPSFGSRALLTDPSDPTASPYGWQDVNGVAGAEYTITRGNNVYAYEDANNDNLPGYSPNGGANLHFDFPFTPNATPITNQDASLTNLFYVNNTVHDVLYGLGFNEAAGNFQQNNYGRGGLGGDYVLAEGFDGSGTNNANFNTPPDGSSGRMQMYLFTGNSAACTNLNITSSGFTGAMSIVMADFSALGSVTANLVLVNDGIAPVTDACSAITNNISGKIALIDRGTCNFINKAQAAQTAGAMGVIIANNVSGAPPGMSGTPTLSIPCVSISMADGNTLKTALSGTVIATINTCIANQLDGSFDNGVVAHEYGHGVSNRLTGGPSQASCLTNGEQGGEGWSDWLALMMTIEPGDQGSNSRGIGTYVLGQPTTGGGIRRYPYSTNMSINPQTYGNLALSSEVHNIGEIWCDAIWDMSWLLIDQYGFSSTLSPTSGNYIAIKLVLEGMKLQPCGPGFLDARDAIVTADAVLYNNAHRCLIWQAFARRGMGFNASQGSANVAGDETEGFSLPSYCMPATQAPVAIFTSDVNTIACGGVVHFTDHSTQAFDWLWNFGDQTTSTLQSPAHTFTAPGTHNVKLVVTNPLGSDSVTHSITVTSTFSVNVTASPTTICSGDTVHLNAVASGSAYKSYTVTNIPFAPVSGTDSTVSLADDQVSSAKVIGFPFNFFGTNYSVFYICSNGFITFSPNIPAAYYSEATPSTVTPNNFIALCWNDLNPQNAGSSISFFRTGSTPNRKLVVKYNTSHYGGTSYPFVVQVILYETSNIIEIHTTTISDASAYDPAANTLQGVENADGSAGVAVPGRNSTIFSASNDAYRFTPFTPYAYTWLPGNLNGASQTVTPVATGTYAVKVTDGTACLAPFVSPLITVNTCTLSLNLNVFIQGFYTGGNAMTPVLENTGFSNNATHCDSIIVELHNQFSPSTIFRTDKVLLNTNGQASVTYPGSIIGSTYYIVIRTRNAIETWSKMPVTMSAVTTYDFTH